MAVTLPDDLKLDALRGLDTTSPPGTDTGGSPPEVSTTAPVVGRAAPVVTGLTPTIISEVPVAGPSEKLSGNEIVEISQKYFSDLGSEVASLDPETANGLVDPASPGLSGADLDVAKVNFIEGVKTDLANTVIREQLTPDLKTALIQSGENILEGQNFDLLLGKDGSPNELFIAPDLNRDELAAALQDAVELIFEVNAQEQGLTLNQDAFDQFIAGFTETFFVALRIDVRVEADNADAKQDENLARIARETLMISRTAR